jgi:DNA segregation ATPase FtsK/SpoIIIE, S-DNA-T family
LAATNSSAASSNGKDRRAGSRRAEPAPGRFASLRSAVLREAALIGMLALAVFLVLAMASYSPDDPAWSYRGTDLEVTNLVGRSGAWCADLLLSLFGILAYAIPVALVFAAVSLFRMQRWSWPILLVRSAGWVISITAGAVLARMHAATEFALPANVGPGGMIGDWLVRSGLPLFNWLGLTLIALVGLALGVQAALGFSWLGLAEATGRLIYRVTGYATQLLDRYYDRMLARRQRRLETRSHVAQRKAAVQAEQSLKKVRKPPAIQPPPAPARKSAKALQKPLFEPTGTHEARPPGLDRSHRDNAKM